MRWYTLKTMSTGCILKEKEEEEDCVYPASNEVEEYIKIVFFCLALTIAKNCITTNSKINRNP